MKLIENTDYEFVPNPHNDEGWQVRFLSGDYIETLISYGTVRLKGLPESNEIDDKTNLAFNFDIVSTPAIDLTEDDVELQNHAAAVLVSIIEDAVETKSGKIKLSEAS